MNRRSWCALTVTTGAAAVLSGIPAPLLGPVAAAANETPKLADQGAHPTVRYCLNTSTIRGHKLPLDVEVRKIAAAGYDAIEPWMGEIDDFVKGGGKLSELRKEIADLGMTVESGIGFANWIVEDAAQRATGIEQLKRDLDSLQKLGGKRIAAPPAGATDVANLDLRAAADRYRTILEVSQQFGVIPQLELWGFSKSLSRLGELLYVASEAGHPDACVLLDVYHIYKGGSDFRGLELVAGGAVHVLHMNDYPQIDREQIGDADRVYPGSGVAPVAQVLRTLMNNGFRGVLSLELFNRQYWELDVDKVLQDGLRSMQSSVARAVLP